MTSVRLMIGFLALVGIWRATFFVSNPMMKNDEHALTAFHVVDDRIRHNLTRYNQPNISTPNGCIEPKKQDHGWPITDIGTCHSTSLFQFNEQLARPKSDRNMKTIPTESSFPCDPIMRCTIMDFRHVAHFILNFIPCWSTWWEHIQTHNTNTKLMLVGGDIKVMRIFKGDEVSTFAKDWMEIFDCFAEINGKSFGKQLEDGCKSWEREYVNVSLVTDVRGLPFGNKFHFDTPADRHSPTAGMNTYFFHPDHAYALRLIGHSKVLGKGKDRAVKEKSIPKNATPTFHVLFINRNKVDGQFKRVIGGPDIANITSNIRAKLSDLGIPATVSRINETDDFGKWDGFGQMKMMSEHDIIISPHGNQWSSIGFAPECAAVLEVYPFQFAVPGFFLPWAVNAGIQALGLYNGRYILGVQENLEQLGRHYRKQVRDTAFINTTDEIIMALPALVQARTECCQILLDNEEWRRAITARCVQ